MSKIQISGEVTGATTGSGKIEDTSAYNAKNDNDGQAHAAELAREAASKGEKGRGLTKEEQKAARRARLAQTRGKKAVTRQEDVDDAFAKLENLKGERQL